MGHLRGPNTSYSTGYAINRADAPDTSHHTNSVRQTGTERFLYNRGQPTREPFDANIPPFNGKEDWKVWVNRCGSKTKLG